MPISVIFLFFFGIFYESNEKPKLNLILVFLINNKFQTEFKKLILLLKQVYFHELN